MGLVLDHLDAGAPGGVHHLEGGFHTALVIDADLSDDERWMSRADLAAGNRDLRRRH
jgi:hypothetical protein